MLAPLWDRNDLEELRRTTVALAHPTRTWDGEGTLESIDTTTSITVGIQVHENTTYAVFEDSELLQIGDLLRIA
jgi:hypothetical protein